MKFGWMVILSMLVVLSLNAGMLVTKSGSSWTSETFYKVEAAAGSVKLFWKDKTKVEGKDLSYLSLRKALKEKVKSPVKDIKKVVDGANTGVEFVIDGKADALMTELSKIDTKQLFAGDKKLLLADAGLSSSSGVRASKNSETLLDNQMTVLVEKVEADGLNFTAKVGNKSTKGLLAKTKGSFGHVATLGSVQHFKLTKKIPLSTGLEATVTVSAYDSAKKVWTVNAFSIKGDK